MLIRIFQIFSMYNAIFSRNSTFVRFSLDDRKYFTSLCRYNNIKNRVSTTKKCLVLIILYSVEMLPTFQEQQVKKLKRLLDGWRMALLPLKSVILWEQQWHPCAIVGSISSLYFLIWLMDLNTLTTFAVVGLILNFIDFIVPIICNSLYGPTAWTGQKEKMFEDICRSIVASYNKTLHQFCTFYSLRETSPCMVSMIKVQ